MGKRATIQDIAQKSGYSKTAVSFAFNAPEKISAEARDRILCIARELGYSPDPMARNFSKGRHMAIGFLLPQNPDKALDNPYTQAVITAIAEVCQENGYVLSIIPPFRSSIPEAVKNAPVDGLITMGLYVDRNIRDALRGRCLPVVSIDGLEEDGFPSVGIDDEAAGYLQMNKVLGHGHKDIAVVSLPKTAYGKSKSDVTRRREAGYERALAEAGMSLSSILMVESSASYSGGKEAADRILSDHKPSCIVTMADIAALGVISSLSSRGISIPEDVSVVGFDGIEHTAGPVLSTIVQSASEKGRLSASMLFSAIGDDSLVTERKHIGFAFQEGATLRRIYGY